MKVYYIWDAYCGWCYGFDKVLLPFLKNHEELELEMISGGLFEGKRIGEFQHIKGANKQISEIFGVEFSDKYNEVLDEGKLVMNSIHPAIGFSILKDYLTGVKLAEAGYEIQKEFYLNGRSLSDIEVYKNVAKKFSLNIDEISKKIEEQFAKGEKYHEDFITAYNLGAKGYPTVLIEKDGKFYDLRSGAMTTEELERNYSLVKEL